MTWVKRRFQAMTRESTLGGTAKIEDLFKALCQTVKAEAVRLADVSLDEKVQTWGVRMKKLVREKSVEEISMKMRETE